MNKSDPDYNRLKTSIAKILEAKNENDSDKKTGLYLGYIDVCQDILVREWKVVKDEITHFDESLK